MKELCIFLITSDNFLIESIFDDAIVSLFYHNIVDCIGFSDRLLTHNQYEKTNQYTIYAVKFK